MDYINLVEGYIYCINQTGVTKAGFYFLMVLVFYALFSNTLAVRPHSRVGQIRRFVYVAPKSKHLGPTNPWIPKFLNLNLDNHLRLGLEVL